MSAYLKQEFDFIERTKTIIEQYDAIKDSTKYEVTLFMNCFIGLLILPQQHWYDKLPDIGISEKEWGISPDDISFIKKCEKKDINNISRHLRNSISHYRFTAFKDDSNNISKISFHDNNKHDVKTFEATLSVSSLKKFVFRFSELLCDIMKKEKIEL